MHTLPKVLSTQLLLANNGGISYMGKVRPLPQFLYSALAGDGSKNPKYRVQRARANFTLAIDNIRYFICAIRIRSIRSHIDPKIKGTQVLLNRVV